MTITTTETNPNDISPWPPVLRFTPEVQSGTHAAYVIECLVHEEEMQGLSLEEVMRRSLEF